MSAISKSVLRQTSRLYYLNLTRPAILPFSTSSRSLAEPEDNSTSGRSFDSVRKSIDDEHFFEKKLLIAFLAVHLGPLGKLVMVLGGLHRRVSDVPDTIP